MLAKLIAVKISLTVCQGIWKEQKRNSDVYPTECRKGNADGLPSNLKSEEKEKENRGNGTCLIFITRKINLPQFFLCKVHLAENRTFLFIVLTLNTASYFNVIAFCEGKKRKLSAVSKFLLEKIKAGCGEYKLVERQNLTWKSRMLLVQSPSWKSGKKLKEQSEF